MDIQDAARQCRSNGWSPIRLHGIVDGLCTCDNLACGSPGKHPIDVGWQNYEVPTFEGWSWNVGIKTGRAYGLFVVDVDSETSWQELTAKYGPVECYNVVRTSSGYHYYFSYPETGDWKSGASVLADGVDIRADGGYVVGPPSKHASGATYEWVKRGALQPPPQWVLDLINQKKNKRNKRQLPEAKPEMKPTVDRSVMIRRGVEYISRMPDSVEGSNGSLSLWNVAQSLVKGLLLTREEAFAIIQEHYNHEPRCKPEWDEDLVWHKIDEVIAKSTSEDGYLLTESNGTIAESQANKSRADIIRKMAPFSPDLWREPGGGMPLEWDGSVASICQILRSPDTGRVALGGRWPLQYDEMGMVPLIAGSPLEEVDIITTREQLQNQFKGSKGKTLNYAKNDVFDALVLVAMENKFNPLTDYLHSLSWDGVNRVDNVASIALGTGDELSAVLVKKFMIACVARALRPGCKVDTCLILTGPQGQLKSTFFKTLVGDKWFSDTFVDIKSKDAVMAMRNIWVIEWAELQSIIRSDSESVKAFLSSAVDRIRPPYERSVKVMPRYTVVVGTTNDDEFLTDSTGNRRMWVVRAPGELNNAWVSENRDQLWAEAMSLHARGKQWWLTEAEDNALRSVHSKYERSDEWESPLRDWALQHDEIVVAEFLALGLNKPVGTWTTADGRRVGAILRRMGYQKVRVRKSELGGCNKTVWEKSVVVPKGART